MADIHGWEILFRGSFLLIGLAIALAGVAGVVLPKGSRSAAVFSLAGGTGVGIAFLALVADPSGNSIEFWRTFFWGSVAGFATVCGCLGFAAWRVRQAPRPTAA